MSELSKKNDQASQKEIERLQQEITEHFGAMMPELMKQMAFSIIVILPLFGFIQGNYLEAIISLPVPIPFFAAFDWFNPVSWFSFRFFESTSWLGWYVLVSIIVGIALSIIFKLFEMFKEGVFSVKAK